LNIKTNEQLNDDHLTQNERYRMQHYFVRQFIVFILGFMVCITLHAQPSETIATEKGFPPNSYPIHGSDLLWKQELEVRKFVAEHPEALKSNSLHKTAWTFGVGSTKSWYADNLITGLTRDRYQIPSTCRAVGTNCYIFVEDSSWGTRVNQPAVDSILLYFNSKTPANPSMGIFATDTSAFGNPPDVDHDPRIIILLLNIKDGYSGSGGFVEGYFYSFNEVNPSTPGYSTSNFAEMFYIDTNPLNLTTSGGLTSGISTLAHEFQHMIHFNYDKYEMSFVNEGCSVLAEVNCGFPIYNPVLYANEPNHYLLDWRSGDNTHVLNDYSRAARFFVYLRDQVGIGVFKKIVASTQIGTAGIDAGLLSYGSPLRFNGILRDWFIANILEDRSVDSLYGYSYPKLPKPIEQTFFNPNVALTTDTVKNYAVEYLAFKAGSQLHATFTSSNPALIIKAVEIGPSAKRVLDVIRNVEFTEPLFGTTYYEIHFVVMNTDPNTQAIYSYTTSGTGGITQTTLSYAGSPNGYMIIPSSNQKLAVRFSPAVSGQLYSVSVDLNGGVAAIQGSGKLRVSACQNISGSIGGIPGTLMGTSVDVPFSQLSSGSWNEVNMQGANVSITTGTDFHIVVEVAGIIGDTLQFLLDDGIATPTSTRTSSYRNGVNGLGWYNRADPNYGKPVSHENLLLTASIAVPTAVIEVATQTNVPQQYKLEQNYPNPFNPSTTIKFQMPSKGFVKLKIYDMIGREVATLVDGFQEAGTHDVKFDASNLPSGVYFYRITTGTYAATKKLVLIK
jgi:Peptidase M30.